jgi:hypothetical protein
MADKTAMIAGMESQTVDLKSQILGLQEDLAAALTAAVRDRESAALAAAALDQKLADLTRHHEARIAQIQAASERKMAELSDANAKQIDEYNRKMFSLLNQLKEKEAVLVTLGGQKQALELSLAKQRQDFSALEEKYIRLIRPARSPAGKKVVTVHYQRENGRYRIGFKGVDTEKVEMLTLEQLHQQLGDLKQKWQEQLYVKVVIPENSGLTYNEAWTFTKDVLSRYDYYYTE